MVVLTKAHRIRFREEENLANRIPLDTGIMAFRTEVS